LILAPSECLQQSWTHANEFFFYLLFVWTQKEFFCGIKL